MLSIRALLFITILPTPVLVVTTTELSPFSPVFPVVLVGFAALTGLLIAGTTTRTRDNFFRKLVPSCTVAASYFLMIFAVSALWSHEYSVTGSIALLMGPIHRMAAVGSVVLLIIAGIALTRMSTTVESPELTAIRNATE